MSKKVAIYGLSANPIHMGHVDVVKYLVDLKKFDSILILPVYDHIFRYKSLIDFKSRVTMCEISLVPLGNEVTKVEISLLEKTVKDEAIANGSDTRIGTVDILRYMKQMNSQIELHLVLGTDTFNDLSGGKWKEGPAIFEMVTLHVINRPGIALVDQKYINQGNVFLYAMNTTRVVSSTEIRESNPYPFWPLCSFENEKLKDQLHPKVYQFIKENKLYCFAENNTGSMKKHRAMYSMIVVACGIYYQYAQSWSIEK